MTTIDRSKELALLQEFREILLKQGRDDDDDVILEIMDEYQGWCSPHVAKNIAYREDIVFIKPGRTIVVDASTCPKCGGSLPSCCSCPEEKP